MRNAPVSLLGLAAIILAAALGVALGAGPLQGDSDDRLRGQVQHLRDRQDQLRSRLRAVDRVDRYRDSFAQAVGPGLVQGELSGRSVVLVRLPGAPGSTVHQLHQTLSQADATVTGVVRVTSRWARPGQRQFLDGLTSRLVTAGVRLAPGDSTYLRAGTLLAHALLTDDDAEVGKTGGGLSEILQGYRAGHLLGGDRSPARAELAVVVAPQQAAGDGVRSRTHAGARLASSETAYDPWLALAVALDETGDGVVVAGDSGTTETGGGLVAAVRADRRVAAGVSTVDVADLPSGQASTVWALVEQYQGDAGQYGAAGADGALPRLAGSN